MVISRAEGKIQVLDDQAEITAEIAILIDVPDDFLSNEKIRVVLALQAELTEQSFGHRTLEAIGRSYSSSSS